MAMLPPDPIYIFKGEMLSVSCLGFKINSLVQRIYAGTQSGKVHVWDLMSKREAGNFQAGEDTCLSLCIPSEEELVITHTKSGEISFWQEDSTRWILKKLIRVDFFGFCKCQTFENVLYVSSKDSRLELVSVKTAEVIRRIKLEGGGRGDAMAFKVFERDEKKLALVAHEGLRLGLWDLDEEKETSGLALDECPMAVDYDCASCRGLCGGPGDKVLVFLLDKNLDFKVRRKVELKNPGVAAVKIRPDGKLVAVGCWDGRLRLYSWKNLVLLGVLDVHSATVQDVCFGENFEEGSKTKILLAAGSQDSKISLWDLYN